jgi:hypothetical protein
VARVTDGRYKRVRVDDTDLGIEVHSPEKGDWVPVTDLSQGTLDVVYLAARIGLVRLVTGDRRPPLVMDDPFVTLDDDRAKRALELLKDISTDFQVIYLTTSDRYDAAADKVQVLAPATALTPDLDPSAEPGGSRTNGHADVPRGGLAPAAPSNGAAATSDEATPSVETGPAAAETTA